MLGQGCFCWQPRGGGSASPRAQARQLGIPLPPWGWKHVGGGAGTLLLAGAESSSLVGEAASLVEGVTPSLSVLV